jgi:hypothetical protein
VEDESTVAHHDSLTELFRVPSLRSVYFDYLSSTPALCQATANAFMEGTGVTKLEFKRSSFSALECAVMIANGLSRDTSVSPIIVESPFDQMLHSALATALPSNSTLRELTSVGWRPRLSPVISAFEKNSGIKSLKVDVGDESMDESLSTAIKDGFGMNETLESLELHCVYLTDDKAALWCQALSFLRANKALKSLKVNVQDGVTESCLSAFVSMLWPYCKRMRHLRIFSSKAIESKSKLRRFSF